MRRTSMMQALFVAGVGALFVASAHAQLAIYSNGSSLPSTPALNATALTGSGVSAPGGGLWSEVAALSPTESNALAGVSGQSLAGGGGTYRFAEDFTVGANHTWNVQVISFYAYQPGASAAVSPFSAVNVRVWSGKPGDVGSTVIWGDTTTNRLASATSSGIYRVFNTTTTPATAPDSSRLIWRVDAAVTVALVPGTYWLDWQIVSASPTGEAFAPTVTIPGVRTNAAWNARQFKPDASAAGAGAWTAISDPGKPSRAADVGQALPFILRGAVTGCVADFDLSGTPTIDDLFIFINAWLAGDPRCDVNGGGVSIDDLFVFINAWLAGCP